MKAYMVIRDIIFFVLLCSILCVCIFTAKMTDVIDSNLIYVNRKVPPLEGIHRPEIMHHEDIENEVAIEVDEENISEEGAEFEDFTANPDQEIPEWVERTVWIDAIFN